ncbi:hypothetical protein ONA23_03985 [Mycoplasmopsis cynos]|uniref:hypothetical protein n=1 Tax=Mycoplasmopsis cynos TaxID=171284 RepID=UPI0024CA3B39|nr:hypothetical protein [Mycoplasmopsis cynos]WAM06170.1 hypothetical protein ONA23_03985 [Mycoplasmopsis cynos]
MNNEEELIFFDEMESNNPSETKNETKPETKKTQLIIKQNLSLLEQLNQYWKVNI